MHKIKQTRNPLKIEKNAFRQCSTIRCTMCAVYAAQSHSHTVFICFQNICIISGFVCNYSKALQRKSQDCSFFSIGSKKTLLLSSFFACLNIYSKTMWLPWKALLLSFLPSLLPILLIRTVRA